MNIQSLVVVVLRLMALDFLLHNEQAGRIHPVRRLAPCWSPGRWAAILACCAAMSGCSTTRQSNEATAPKPEATTGKLFFSEPFDYPQGERLTGKNGGTGFAQAWGSGGFNSDPNAPHVIGGASLAYGNLATSAFSIDELRPGETFPSVLPIKKGKPTGEFAVSERGAQVYKPQEDWRYTIRWHLK